MTANLEENLFERDVRIFRAHLTGLPRTALSPRFELSAKRIDQVVKGLVDEIISYLQEHSLPVPEKYGRVDRLNDKAFWVSALDQYLEHIQNSKVVITMTDPVIKIGVTENAVQRLKLLDVITVGDLLDRLITKKHEIIRLYTSTSVTFLDAIERKLRIAGFNPYGGRNQVTVSS